MNPTLSELVRVSQDMAKAPVANYGCLLAKRREVLAGLENVTPSEAVELTAADNEGRKARVRLAAELGLLRAKIQELQQLRVGLQQLLPEDSQPPSLEVRI